ncbi:MAG: gamma-glutamyltransferase family protein [Yoonia sp.]|nr:gamma-glutamyltransferase family protein [Yoonia sp.]MDG1863734.1 gamma-glutamyltransferase family protein [Yoonia sp.]
MTFTTRPELKGTYGMVTSTHWMASAVGMRLLERGGNAFDAGAAMGFVLHVVEPHLNGPFGDMPALIRPADAAEPTVVCGQGTAPAGATIAHYKSEGLDMIPGSGLLATVIPGAFDAWMLILRDHGKLPLRDVLEPAIHYARAGHPMLPRVAATISGLADFFREEWPTSAATWLPNGQVPAANDLFCNPALADMWDRLLTEAEIETSRTAQIEAARRVFSHGFIAEAIDAYLRDGCVMDAAGGRRRGVLTGQDMAGWQATYEAPLSTKTNGLTVWKAGAWTQGPSLLQTLNVLDGMDIDPTDTADFTHKVTEVIKLSMADREAYYGDPAFHDLPIATLLSRDYADMRRQQIGPVASLTLRPGVVASFESWADAAVARSLKTNVAGPSMGAGEPTMAHLTEKRGDTVHIDVVDRWGNMISATPSGGWLQSSPVIPGLGVPLNSRAQMFWLKDGTATSLAPGHRPRTTLSPSMAEYDDGTRMAFGTPGGDQQDQWQAIFLMRLLHQGLDLQAAIDAPLFHTAHLQASFYPRNLRAGHLTIEPSAGADAIAALRARGHLVEVSEPWAIGRLTAVSRAPTGMLRGAATPRLMQAYAIGR